MHTAPDYVIAEYTAEHADERVRRRRRRVIGSIISLVLSLAISTGLVIWRWEVFTESWVVWIPIGVITLLAVARLVFWQLAHRRAVTDRERVGEGPALVIGRFGVELHGVRLDWGSVQQLAIGKGRLGTGPDVVVAGGPEPLRVGLEHLDVRPATLESATRIFSGGRRSLDLRHLED